MTGSIDVLAIIAKHRDLHMSMALADAYSAQEYPNLRNAHAAVAELIEALRWYVENDDRIESMPCNDFWLAGRDRAIALLARIGETP